MSGPDRTRGAPFRNADLTKAAPLTQARYLFVVSRQHSALYELLIERFQDDKNVEVVLDRRAGMRKSAEQFAADERRRRPPNELHARSHLIITRTDPSASWPMPT